MDNLKDSCRAYKLPYGVGSYLLVNVEKSAGSYLTTYESEEQQCNIGAWERQA